MFVGFSKAACFTTHHQFRCPLAPWTPPALGHSQGSHPPAHVSQMSLFRVHPTPFLPLPALLGFPRALLGRVRYSEIWASQPLSRLSFCTLAPLHTSAPAPSRVLGFYTPQAWALCMLFPLPGVPFPHLVSLRSTLRLCVGVTSSKKPSSPAAPHIPQVRLDQPGLSDCQHVSLRGPGWTLWSWGIAERFFEQLSDHIGQSCLLWRRNAWSRGSRARGAAFSSSSPKGTFPTRPGD